MTERYDHRDLEQRVEDAGEDEVIDRPVQDGATELRTDAMERVEAAEADGEPLATDPAGSADPPR